MAKIKGSGKEIMERTLKKFGPDTVKQYYAHFSQEQLDIVNNAHGVQWVEMEMDEKNNGLQLAAELLFPNDPKQLRKLGQAMAEHGFSVFYKIFFRLPSLPNLFKKVAAQWAQMYDTGQASVKDIQKKSAVFVVSNFPDYPAYMREYMCGFYEGMAKLNGAKNPRIKKDESNPNEWCWELQWD